MLGQIGHDRLHTLGVGQQGVSLLQQHLALMGQGESPVFAVQQRDPKFRLQLFDGGGDGWLGDMQQLCRRGDAAQMTGGLEIAQLRQFHEVHLMVYYIEKTYKVKK